MNLNFFKTNKYNLDLKIVFYFSIFCLILSSVFSIIDDRILNFAPIWLKPFKFAISSIIYSFTLLYFISFIQNEKYLLWANRITAYGLIIELVIIYLQAYRGRMSHFNFLTLEDMILFQIMAVAIVLVWLVFFIYIKGFFSISLNQSLFVFSVRLGLILTFLAMPMAFTMTQPTASDLKKIEANQKPIGLVLGSHSVSEKDETKRLPFTSWSRTGGDLRIAHFLGLHAMQILPLFGLLLLSLRFGFQIGKTLILLVSIIYFGFVIFTLVQALNGIPLIN
jgi:hypothetical protein